MNATLTSPTAKRIAALMVFIYIGVQLFQEYVFSHSPATGSLGDELLQGATAPHLWRAVLLLLSFYGLMHVFVTISAENLIHHFTSTVFALVGLLSFCFLEILLRSVELFYFQIHLPTLFRKAAGLAQQQALLDQFALFQQLQYSLYFPLMLSQALGSAVLALAFVRRRSLDYLVTFGFALNALRLLGRLLGMFLHVTWLATVSDALYLPSVIAVFGPIGVWLAIASAGARTGHPLSSARDGRA